MFPISEARLPFLKIADYWAREIQPPATRNELLGLLESAWWLGEICGEPAISRLEMLKGMYQSMHDKSDLGVVFIVGQNSGKSLVEELPDGSVVVDVRHRVPLPSSDATTWDETACNNSFRALAQTSSIESYPGMTPVLAAIELAYDEFARFVASRGYTKPQFWRPLSATGLEKPSRGRPAEYNWIGVKSQLMAYALEHGPVQSLSELLEKCANFAQELHTGIRYPTTRQSARQSRNAP